MKVIIQTVASLWLATFAGAALAHHSAVMFDFQNTVIVEGKVEQVRFANPHMKLILEVTDEKGTRHIEFEGHSRNNMMRQGLTPSLFTEGDSIAIRIAPMRNGEDGGYVTAVRGPDGTEVGRVTSAD